VIIDEINKRSGSYLLIKANEKYSILFLSACGSKDSYIKANESYERVIEVWEKLL